MADTLTPRHFAIIRVAKEQVGMSEGDYRAILFRLTGQETAKALNPDTFKRLMAHLEAMGFRSTAMRRIAALWSDFTDGTGTDTGLRHWMEKRGYGSSVAWLENGTARRVIAALTNMVAHKAQRLRASGDRDAPP